MGQAALAFGIDVVELNTDADYLPAVKTMLTERERRRAH